MSVGNPNDDALLLGADERGIFVRAQGSIRATLCYPLRDTLLSGIETGAALPAVHIDLSDCRYMDSTFIGLLVAVDKKLRAASGARLKVLRPSVECMDILSQIGLQKYLSIVTQDTPLPPSMQKVTSDETRPGAEFILKAHEALMETSEEARRKFALLKEMLERKLRAEKPPKGTPEG